MRVNHSAVSVTQISLNYFFQLLCLHTIDCNNFCLKSKHSSIAVVISIHTALVLYTLMEIQILGGNSIISSKHFFLVTLIYPFFKKKYAENLNLVYNLLSIKNIWSLGIKDYFWLLFYSFLYPGFVEKTLS